MIDRHAREVLKRTVSAARRRLFFQSCAITAVRSGVIVLPLAAVAVAVDQRITSGEFSALLLVLAAAIWLGITTLIALMRLRSPLDSALALDEGAALKDRLSSAWEFLSENRELDEPRLLQIRDAIRHAESLNIRAVLRPQWSRATWALPVFAAFVAASFLVPARFTPQVAEAAIDQRTSQQLEELRQLQQDLDRQEHKSEEVERVLRNLKDIERRFEQGEMAERDVMIELARLDDDLRQKMKEAGVESLGAEINQLVPHLMASDASKPVAMALKEQEMEKAAEELEKLGDKQGKGELTKEQQEQLAMNMGVAASKLGNKQQGSFGGDLSKASESLKSGDKDGFEGSMKSMSDKMSSLSKFRKMDQMRKRLSMCKASLGQKKSCSACGGSGCSACNGNGEGKEGKEGGYGQGKGKGKGGLKAGMGTTGDPFGDANRLQDSYKKMLEVKGMASDGPVESEVEVTEGQTSESEIAATDIYAEYAAVAEEAIEREEIPLSHRFHVKRYFQAIRPTE